jgi:hypothetical protein
MVSEDELREAELEGVPCLALAWMNVTRLDVVTKGRPAPIEGVRTWRGMAVVKNVNGKIVSTWFNRIIRYSGWLRRGNEEQRITAHVFVTSFRRTHPGKSQGEPESDVWSTFHIEFTGAGNV